MKLREKTRGGRKPKGADLVLPSREPGLNEQVGLPKELEQQMRSFLEVDFGDLGQHASQLETAVSLVTLFPDEADKFRQQAPIDKAFFTKVKQVGVASDASNIAAGFAVYKLLLAEKIRLTPSGILLAVEPSDLRGKKSLPERSLAV